MRAGSREVARRKLAGALVQTASAGALHFWHCRFDRDGALLQRNATRAVEQAGEDAGTNAHRATIALARG